MGARTPAEAFRRFIEAIEADVSCLDPCKITVSPGGRTDKDGELAYRDRLSCGADEIFMLHWHPRAESAVTQPHAHLRIEGVDDALRAHLPTPRMSLEDAIGWAISLGFPAARSDWADVLERSRRMFQQYRTW